MMNKLEKESLWVEAAKRYHLSTAHVKMARELGLNPKKLGGMANHKQERWKVPLPEFIEELHERRFRKKRPRVGKQPVPILVAKNQTRNHEQRTTQPGQVADGVDGVPF